MAEERNGGGGFGWFILGGLIGLVAGAYIASGPGRGQVDTLRSKTIELSGSEPVQKAREAQDGVAAAKRKREELESAAQRKLRQTNGDEGES